MTVSTHVPACTENATVQKKITYLTCIMKYFKELQGAFSLQK